ncbi:type I toxin-antitoxin system SymE family toxin [Butyricicoccus sp. 1XD8-22]|nr:type I toxin-antitoxin system SymE family toxin [Butyricicoccus sp. 1XD8-22]
MFTPLSFLFYDGFFCPSNRVWGHGNYKQAPPQIVLQGKWLEQTGFSAGDKITVKCQQGQLIITKNGTRKVSGE